tara:strand:- start:835 stop:1263 length:429 start_codon:yes stop_codon:yes gene_type:complete
LSQISIKRLGKDDWQKARKSVALFWDVVPNRATIVRFLDQPQNILLSAEMGDEPVGQLIAYVLDRWDRDESELFLYSIDVVKTHRRKGVGKALVEELRKLGRAQGCLGTFVFTNESNFPAMQLYQTTGGNRSNPDDVMFEYD